MKVLFYLGHPAHYHLFKNAIREFGPENSVVLIKTKDVLERLLIEDKIPYINVDESSSRNQAGKTLKIARKFGKRMLKIYRIIRKQKPDILTGSAAELAVLGKVLGIPSCIFNEDDYEIVAPFAKIVGPTATHLVCPDVTSAWKWNHKKLAYNSYHELAYLHPDHFTPDRNKVAGILEEGKRNFILRFVELGAYHDVGKTGLTDELATRLIQILEPHGKIYITSERELPPQFEPYRIAIKATDIHHALYFADMLIGDSQTMTAEAAVLGTPALRYNDFVGKLSYLEDLEHNFGLTYGFKTSNSEGLIAKVAEMVNNPNLKQEWAEKRKVLLTKKINLAAWMVNLLANYPKSLPVKK